MRYIYPEECEQVEMTGQEILDGFNGEEFEKHQYMWETLSWEPLGYIMQVSKIEHCGYIRLISSFELRQSYSHSFSLES